MKKGLVITAICISVPLIISFLLMMLASVLILKTNIPENFESVFMIIISSLCSVIMTVMLVINSNLKAIMCSAITFLIVILIKILLSLIISNTVIFNLSSIISVAFIALFCFIGGLIGVNFKK